MRTLVMGDIHGCYKGMLQCFERSGFNPSRDRLVQLGDVVDGWSEIYECVELLLTCPHLISLRGNHDHWFQEFMDKGVHPVHWMHGGLSTKNSYLRVHGEGQQWMNNTMIPDSHWKFFHGQHNIVHEDNKIFVHGGFNRHEPFKGQKEWIYYWDRDLWSAALSHAAMAKGTPGGDSKFKIVERMTFDEAGDILEKKMFQGKVFIGHTSTINWGTDKPMITPKVINLDTGAGWYGGKLTIMDADTLEYWQSDITDDLYPNERGRN